MKRIVLVLVLLAACQGCSGPVPQGYQLANQGPAVEAITRYFATSAPNVSFVEADVHDGDVYLGATDPGSGRVFWGLTLGDDVWLALAPWFSRYSETSLCHEVAHRKLGQHDHLGLEKSVWEGQAGATDCKAWLAGQPEIDTIDFGAVQ